MGIKRGVSLYSYQKEYFKGNVDLEGMVKLAAESAHATGISLMPEQMPIGRYPRVYDKEVEWWKGIMEKYKTEPVCLDSMFTTALYHHRTANAEEQRQLIEDELYYASKFGFKMIRFPFTNLHIDIMKDHLYMAEDYGVIFGLEVHIPMSMTSPIILKYLNMIEQTGTKYAGIIPDLHIYTRSASDLVIDNYARAGARKDFMDTINQAYRDGVRGNQLVALAEKLEATALERTFTMKLVRAVSDDVENLRPYVKYVSAVHGKCYYFDENCMETCMDHEGVIKVLKEENYDGYVYSEFDGVKSSLPQFAEEIDEIEQVRRHHIMLSRLIGEENPGF